MVRSDELYVSVLEIKESVSNILLKIKSNGIEYRDVLFTVNARFLLDLCLGHEIQAGIQNWH